MGKIALALKKIISSSGRRFFRKSSGNFSEEPSSGKTIYVLPEEPFSESFPEEPSSGSFPEEGSSGRTNCCSSEKFPEEGSSGRTIYSSGRRFFRMNNLFYRKNLLSKTFRKKVLPDEQFVLPKEPSSGSFSGRRKMKVVAAYLLAVLGGNNTPSADDIKEILGSVGIEADEDRIESFLSEVKGKDIVELIAAGKEKLASVPSGGGGAVAVAAAPGGGGGGAAPAAEVKKEEKVEEKEESDDDMGFSLFD
ncbi:60S acidic ribosomal protein P2B [Glycine soja]|nr:60S acidic ribosomal protein P2B [Glycine soja]